jgi:acyl carrier protein
METFKILKHFIKYDFAHEYALSDLDENNPPLVNGIIDSLRIVKLPIFIEKNFCLQVKDKELIPDNFETFCLPFPK